MGDWALLADQAWRIAACAVMLSLAITEYREGKTILPAFCVAVALVIAASGEKM